MPTTNILRVGVRRTFAALGLLAAMSAQASPVWATTYKVGPSGTFRDLSEVADQLAPGDVVEVEGDATYEGDAVFHSAGTSDQKITLRGVRKNGARPVIAGGEWGLVLWGDHYVVEGFEITGASEGCVINNADDVTIRDAVIHDCGQGVVGGDGSAGALTIEYTEVYACGDGEYRHQLYIATDETLHPGAVFRLQHCFLHDALGGNSVKSRAERTEIHHNWIEGAAYNELDLIGPDYGDPAQAREDADVVGNVIVGRSAFSLARIGGDGSGETRGRYRFVNNTMVLSPWSLAGFYAMMGIESVEMHNNAFIAPAGSRAKLFDGDEAVWTTGQAVVAGSNNWVQSGLSGAPEAWAGTVSGMMAGIRDGVTLDVRLKEGSGLIDGSNGAPASAPGFEFPSPLALPAFLPPPRAALPVDGAVARSMVGGGVDIGAFEFGAQGSDAPWSPGVLEPSGCGCRAAGGEGGVGWEALGVGLLVLGGRRRRRHAVKALFGR